MAPRIENAGLQGPRGLQYRAPLGQSQMASSLAATLSHRGALHADTVALRPRCTAEGAPRARTVGPAPFPLCVSRAVCALGDGHPSKRVSSEKTLGSTPLAPCPGRKGRAAARDTWRVQAQSGGGGGEEERREGGSGESPGPAGPEEGAKGPGEGGPNAPQQDSSGALEVRSVPVLLQTP